MQIPSKMCDRTWRLYILLDKKFSSCQRMFIKSTKSAFQKCTYDRAMKETIFELRSLVFVPQLNFSSLFNRLSPCDVPIRTTLIVINCNFKTNVILRSKFFNWRFKHCCKLRLINCTNFWAFVHVFLRIKNNYLRKLSMCNRNFLKHFW